MPALRILIRRHRHMALLLVALALVIKAAIPAGYMVSRQGTVLTITICADASGGATTQEIVVPNKGSNDGAGERHAKAAAACPYATLALAAIAGADGILLALALAFILALGVAPTPALPLRRIPFLRPPLRGPPAFA